MTIKDCTLEVGIQQVGVQVINARRAKIVGNTVYPQPMQANQVWAVLRDTKSLRREIADLLVAERVPVVSDDVFLGEPGYAGITNRWELHSFRLDDYELAATAESSVAEALDTYLAAAGPAGVQSAGEFSTHLRNVLMEALHSNGMVQANLRQAGGGAVSFDVLGAFTKNIQNVVHAHASQGIVVGGADAGLVEIDHNEVFGAIQGIHVGLSHAGQQPGDRDIADRVAITHNTVSVAVLPLARGRHGIFCGNAHSVLINDNVVRRLNPNHPILRAIPINGIHVHGAIGPFAQVKNNDIRGCATGVRFFPEVQGKGSPLWLVEDNLLLSAVHAVAIRPGTDGLVIRNENNLTG